MSDHTTASEVKYLENEIERLQARLALARHGMCVETSPKVLFENLPEPVQKLCDNDPAVHCIVQAYQHSRIGWNEAMIRLVCVLARQAQEYRELLENFYKWFGAPPEPKPTVTYGGFPKCKEL